MPTEVLPLCPKGQSSLPAMLKTGGEPEVTQLFLSLPGMEHHLPQLADVCAAALGLPDLDCAEQTPVCHDLLPLYPSLWHCSLQPAVRLGHGSGGRAAHPGWRHEPGKTGAGAPNVSLLIPRSQGREQECLISLSRLGLLHQMCLTCLLPSLSFGLHCFSQESGIPVGLLSH